MIASFLHRASGDAALLSEQENLRHEMLLSSVAGDLMLPIGILLWSELTFPGADLGATAKRVLERMQSHLAVLGKTLDEITGRPGEAEALARIRGLLELA